LQSLYEVDENIPSLGLFTERFYTRIIQLADDIDVSVAVSAIGLIKQLLRFVFARYTLMPPSYIVC
jgi:cohesin complex subunit SA-1/2